MRYHIYVILDHFDQSMFDEFDYDNDEATLSSPLYTSSPYSNEGCTDYFDESDSVMNFFGFAETVSTVTLSIDNAHE